MLISTFVFRTISFCSQNKPNMPSFYHTVVVAAVNNDAIDHMWPRFIFIISRSITLEIECRTLAGWNAQPTSIIHNMHIDNHRCNRTNVYNIFHSPLTKATNRRQLMYPLNNVLESIFDVRLVMYVNRRQVSAPRDRRWNICCTVHERELCSSACQSLTVQFSSATDNLRWFIHDTCLIFRYTHTRIHARHTLQTLQCVCW